MVVCHKTKDNKWLQIAMPQYNRHYPIFMTAIGVLGLTISVKCMERMLPRRLSMHIKMECASEEVFHTVQQYLKDFIKSPKLYSLDVKWQVRRRRTVQCGDRELHACLLAGHGLQVKPGGTLQPNPLADEGDFA